MPPKSNSFMVEIQQLYVEFVPYRSISDGEDD